MQSVRPERRAPMRYAGFHSAREFRHNRPFLAQRVHAAAACSTSSASGAQISLADPFADPHCRRKTGRKPVTDSTDARSLRHAREHRRWSAGIGAERRYYFAISPNCRIVARPRIWAGLSSCVCRRPSGSSLPIVAFSSGAGCYDVSARRGGPGHVFQRVLSGWRGAHLHVLARQQAPLGGRAGG